MTRPGAPEGCGGEGSGPRLGCVPYADLRPGLVEGGEIERGGLCRVVVIEELHRQFLELAARVKLLDGLVDRVEERSGREGEVAVDVSRLVGEVRRRRELFELLALGDLGQTDGLTAQERVELAGGRRLEARDLRVERHDVGVVD